MAFKVGDVSFLSNGQPAVVTKKDEMTGNVIVDRKQEEVKKVHRHGYINGLKEQDRETFIKILDKVAETGDPKEKIDTIQGQISELEQDPRNYRIVTYLKSEVAHLMNTFNIKPRTYELPAQ